MIVVLHNEAGVATYWFIPRATTTSSVGAKREAWRAYRGLPHPGDGEFPPSWTRPGVLKFVVNIVHPEY